jgi:hypothetical protein
MLTDAMDHRCGRRHAAAHTVLLRRQGWGGHLVGELADISITGARIAAPRQSFPLRSLLRLEMTVTDEQGRTRLWQVPAMVVRHAGDGIAVMFDEVQPARLIKNLPQAEPAAA